MQTIETGEVTGDVTVEAIIPGDNLEENRDAQKLVEMGA